MLQQLCNTSDKRKGGGLWEKERRGAGSPLRIRTLNLFLE